MKIDIATVSISEASHDDIAGIKSIWEEAELTRPWNDPVQDIKLSLSAKSSVIFLAKIENEIIGTAMVGYDGHRGWIYYLAISKNYQNQGIGKRLVEHAEEWLRLQGVPKTQILIRSDNEKVIKFYENLGFEKSTSLLMGKQLK